MIGDTVKVDDGFGDIRVRDIKKDLISLSGGSLNIDVSSVMGKAVMDQ